MTTKHVLEPHQGLAPEFHRGNQTFQTSHSSGLWFVNLVISGALAGALGCLFENIYLGVGLSFCFFLLFYELTRPNRGYRLLEVEKIKRTANSKSLKKTSTSLKIQYLPHMQWDIQHHMPVQHHPKPGKFANFVMWQTGHGPLDF